MSDLQTFHKFRELPPEIRRQIWAYALNTSAPRAYYVDVDIPSNAQPREGNISGSSRDVIHPLFTERIAAPAANQLLSLMQQTTSSSSRTGVFTAVLTFLKADVNNSVDLPGDPYSGLEAIKQISIPYKAVMFNRNFRRIIMHALAVFPNLRTLFIHLDPADLFAMNKGPASLGDVGHSVDHYSAPPWYFAAEEHQDGMPFLTHTRDRIYYELCPERVLADAKNYRVCWGGFKWFIENPQDVEVKFLSWWNK